MERVDVDAPSQYEDMTSDGDEVRDDDEEEGEETAGGTDGPTESPPTLTPPTTTETAAELVEEEESATTTTTRMTTVSPIPTVSAPTTPASTSAVDVPPQQATPMVDAAIMGLTTRMETATTTTTPSSAVELPGVAVGERHEPLLLDSTTKSGGGDDAIGAGVNSEVHHSRPPSNHRGSYATMVSSLPVDTPPAVARGRTAAPRGGTDVSATTTGAVVSSSSVTSSPQLQQPQQQTPPLAATRCVNPASDINARLDTQVEVRVYPCNNSAGQKKKYTTFTIKPEGVVIQGSNRNRPGVDLGTDYATQIGRKLCRYELSDNRACQLLVTTHGKSFWVVPAPEAFSRHSGTCRLLGDRKHPPAPHTMQVGDFLRVGSVGVVVIETHDGITNCVLSEEKIQRIMKDTTATGGFLDLAETDGENSDDSMEGDTTHRSHVEDVAVSASGDHPVCYMCFDEEDSAENPMITPCKCSGDTKYVHVECLRKWHTAEADNQICFLSSVDATCSVCKSTFKSDFKLRDGRQVKLFKSSLEPPYVSLLVATKHEMAQRLFNTRFQLSFSTLMKPDGRNATRPLLLGRSSGSDMVLDYRTVSARHAAIRFKNGEFVFTDAGSSNGSYLYLRRPLELSPSQAVQFRLGRSMISMKVVNKWNRRLLRAVRGQRSAALEDEEGAVADDRSIGSTDGDIRIMADQTVEAVQRRTRESVMASLPPPGQLSQSSAKHLDLLFALAYPKREPKTNNKSGTGGLKNAPDILEEDNEAVPQQIPSSPLLEP